MKRAGRGEIQSQKVTISLAENVLRAVVTSGQTDIMNKMIASKKIGFVLPGESYVQFTGNTAKELEAAGRQLGVFTNRAGEANALLIFFDSSGVRALPTVAD